MFDDKNSILIAAAILAAQEMQISEGRKGNSPRSEVFSRTHPGRALKAALESMHEAGLIGPEFIPGRRGELQEA